MTRIGLTYDVQEDPQDERQAEFDPPQRINRICAAMEALGHQVVRLGNAGELLAGRDRLAGVAMVLNLAEGTHGRNREAWVPTILDLAGVRYIGSDALALSLGLDKLVCKRLAIAKGIPTPKWLTVDPDHALAALSIALTFPVIVKPRYQGSGIGIDQGAVVHDAAALRGRLQWLFDRWPEPALIEEFIGIGELTVCLIGNAPPTAYPAMQRPIDPQSRLSCHVIRDGAATAWATPLELTESLEQQARRIALAMFEELGCRDMARVDLRVDEQGTVWFLEINPLPSLDPEGSFGLLAEYCGWSYEDVISRILAAAEERA
jgi:D-alanine-D-alanine ligase